MISNEGSYCYEILVHAWKLLFFIEVELESGPKAKVRFSVNNSNIPQASLYTQEEYSSLEKFSIDYYTKWSLSAKDSIHVDNFVQILYLYSLPPVVLKDILKFFSPIDESTAFQACKMAIVLPCHGYVSDSFCIDPGLSVFHFQVCFMNLI